METDKTVCKSALNILEACIASDSYPTRKLVQVDSVSQRDWEDGTNFLLYNAPILLSSFSEDETAV